MRRERTTEAVRTGGSRVSSAGHAMDATIPGAADVSGAISTEDEGPRLNGQIHASDVHKTKPENVWIHDPVEDSPHSLSARFDVPVRDRKLRLVDLVEVQRQVGILQAHQQFGVPDSEVFVLGQMALKRVTTAPQWTESHAQGSIRTQIVASNSRGRARSLVQHFALETPSGLIAIGRAKSSLIPASVYQRVRQHETHPRLLNPRLKGHGFSYEELLQVDREDPLLSDHPSDHLTAIQAIAEVERVARLVASPSDLRALKLTFQRYADADPAPILRLKVSASGRLSAEVVQFGVRRAKLAGLLSAKEVR